MCNSCQTEISDGQALIALEKHWHVWCFKCETCGMILHGEYLNKDGKVYCEKDYQVRLYFFAKDFPQITIGFLKSGI